MNYLYLISQTQNNDWDTYDSAVVCAPDEDTARLMDPSPNNEKGEPYTGWHRPYSSWCRSPEAVIVKYIGTADSSLKVGVVCASFNAG